MIAYLKQQRANCPKLFEIIRFLIVGGVATIIDMIVMALVIYLPNAQSFNNDFFNAFFMEINLNTWLVVGATAIGFIIGLIFNYVFSILYVYDGENKKAKTQKGFWLFTLLSSIGLGIQTFGMYVGYSLIGINEWIVKIVLTIIVLAFNYITRKIFIFKKENNVVEDTEIEDKKEKNEKIKKENESQVVVNKETITKKSLWLNVVFLASIFCFTLVLFNDVGGFSFNGVIQFIYPVVSCILCAFYLFVMNKNCLSKIDFKKNKKLSIFTIFYTIAIGACFVVYGYGSILRKILLGIASCFAIFCLMYWFVNVMLNLAKNFWQNLTSVDKKIFIILNCVGFFIVIFSCLLTLHCTYPNLSYDAFFSFDIKYYVFRDFQANFNDANFHSIRHILDVFGRMVLTVIPFWFSKIFFFVPAVCAVIFALIQTVLISYCVLKIVHFLKVENNILKILLTITLFASSGFLYNMLAPEKFVFALFYTIAAISLYFQKSKYMWLFLALSIGSLTTNAWLLFVLLYDKEKSFKDYISELIFFVIIFVSAILIFGQGNVILNIKQDIESIKYFSIYEGELNPILNKIYQFLLFVPNMILSPEFDIIKKSYYGDTWYSTWQQDPSFRAFSVIGIVICIVCIISFILNRKDRYTQICFINFIFMIVLLGVLGWGSACNEMFIYSSCFVWSVLSLIYKFIDSICKTDKAKLIVLSCLLVAIVGYNMVEFSRILYYGVVNHPTFI